MQLSESGESLDGVLSESTQTEVPEAILAKAENAFASGDFEKVRKLTQQVLSQQKLSPELRSGAEALQKRVSLDPIQASVFVACLALFLYTFLTYV